MSVVASGEVGAGLTSCSLLCREVAMNEKLIVQMSGKRTRIFNTKVGHFAARVTSIRPSSKYMSMSHLLFIISFIPFSNNWIIVTLPQETRKLSSPFLSEAKITKLGLMLLTRRFFRGNDECGDIILFVQLLPIFYSSAVRDGVCGTLDKWRFIMQFSVAILYVHGFKAFRNILIRIMILRNLRLNFDLKVLKIVMKYFSV